MKRVLLIVLAVLLWSPLTAQANDVASTERCWLLQEGRWGEFILKFYVTEANKDVVKAEKLARSLPVGLYDQKVDLSPETRRRMAISTSPYPLHVEIWRQGQGVVELFTRPGLVIGYPDFSKALIPQNDYPQAGCTTQTLYIDLQGPKSPGILGRNMLFTVCPKEERLTAYSLNCNDALLFGWVAGDPADEFMKAEGVAGAPPLRHVCDLEFSRMGGPGKKGQQLSSPLRRLIFDDRDRKWRTDRPGEYPRFYFNQVTLLLNRFGLSFESAPPVRTNKAETQKAGKALMDEILADKNTFITKTSQELLFVTYSLYMMGMPEKQVKEFFLALVDDFSKARGSFDFGSAESAEQAFAAIVEASRSFNPVERDVLYR